MAKQWPEMKTPFVGCGVVIQDQQKENVVIIERKYPPHGFAFPAGMMDIGESAETCAIREIKEETNLNVRLCGVLTVISEPIYDPRWHAVSIYMLGEDTGESKLTAGDDALKAFWVSWVQCEVERDMTAATKLVMADYRTFRRDGSVLGSIR